MRRDVLKQNKRVKARLRRRHAGAPALMRVLRACCKRRVVYYRRRYRRQLLFVVARVVAHEYAPRPQRHARAALKRRRLPPGDATPPR